MATHNDLGKAGEQHAVEYLQQQGYEILETNWIFDKAEIDIIARLGDILAIVEVKTRSSLDFGLPQDFVKSAKIKLLLKAVDQYVQQNDLDVQVRFDIIAVHNEGGKLSIEHLQDAFYHF
ncbi:MAG: YraN family protein [Flavobacterium sp.]|nr:YraN family protein [Flavobacterium sp.]